MNTVFIWMISVIGRSYFEYYDPETSRRWAEEEEKKMKEL